jgi:hypothetical protein
LERKLTQEGYGSKGPGSSYIMLISYPIHWEPITTSGLVWLCLKKHLDAGVSDHAVQTELEQPEGKADQSALAVLLVGVGVAHGVQDS